MNVPHDLADKAIKMIGMSPSVIMVVLIINTAALLGFAYSLHEISNAAERRDGLLETCLKR